MNEPYLPLVSIMIPCYNQARYLVEAVESALQQSYLNIEIIISDDHSQDDTPLLSQQWRNHPHIKYFRNSKNLGRLNNYRKTLRERASGQFVLNLDGDDKLLNKNYIKDAMRFMLENDLKLVFGKRKNLTSIDSQHSYEDSKPANSYVLGRDFFDKYLEESIAIPHLTTLYERKTAIRFGFYVADIISSDRHSVLNMIFDQRCGYLDQVAGGWRETGQNISRQISLTKRLENLRLPSLVVASVSSRATNTRIKGLNRWQKKYEGKLICNYLAMYFLRRKYATLILFFCNALLKYPISTFIFFPKEALKKITS